ncbi:uncharacterized protein LOC143876499 [Tasmannia lanceolata]|uniref:uncharacterized protein LOC143876499 n=1 Tax=Tasmannia lanceolata TaxID=3420 RepID=UPI004063F4FB
MPTRAVCCGEKAVLVTVYVEKPRRQRHVSPNRHRHHHHHHHHRYHRLKQKETHSRGGGAYDRRADLLLYSQHLRETARSESVANTPVHPPLSAPNNPQHITRAISVHRKRKYSPTCLGDWKKVLLPSFIRSLGHFQRKKEKKKTKKQSGSVANKMNALVKSFDVKKKWGFVSKLFSTLGKGR